MEKGGRAAGAARAPIVVEVDTVEMSNVSVSLAYLLTTNFCSEPCTAQSRHSSLRRVLVLPGGVPLLACCMRHRPRPLTTLFPMVSR